MTSDEWSTMRKPLMDTGGWILGTGCWIWKALGRHLAIGVGPWPKPYSCQPSHRQRSSIFGQRSTTNGQRLSLSTVYCPLPPTANDPRHSSFNIQHSPFTFLSRPLCQPYPPLLANLTVPQGLANHLTIVLLPSERGEVCQFGSVAPPKHIKRLNIKAAKSGLS